MKIVHSRELQVGDTIRHKDDKSPWSSCMVEKVGVDTIHLFRPYGTTSGFTFGDNSTICYIGIEKFEIQRNRDDEWELLQRQ